MQLYSQWELTYKRDIILLCFIYLLFFYCVLRGDSLCSWSVLMDFTDPDQEQVPSLSSLRRRGKTPHELSNTIRDMGRNLGKGNSKRDPLFSDSWVCVCVCVCVCVIVCTCHYIFVRTNFSFTPEKWRHFTFQVEKQVLTLKQHFPQSCLGVKTVSSD